MKLYILGPAFGLPSIDAECIAAVALVKSHCQSANTSWELIASHEAPSDTNTSAHLPLLQDGDRSFSGFNSIAEHIVHSTGTISGLAADLNPSQRADATALSSFVSSTAQPLLDVSLYLSFENYRLRTRSAYTQILPWYANFLLPPRLRSAAKARTAHLNLSALDIDSVHEDVIDKPQSLQQPTQGPHQFAQHETEKHARRLLGPKSTLKAMLQRPEHAAAFRINALADAFFEPLADMLANKQYLLGTTSPAAVDCLAFGYLSLMLYPRMPQPWLQEALKTRFPKLKSYVDRLRARFDMDATPEQAHLIPHSDQEDARRQSLPALVDSSLPWQHPYASGFLGALGFIAHDVYSQLPLPNSGAQVKSLPQRDYETGWMQKTIPYLPALTLFSMMGSLMGYWFYLDRPWPRGEAIHYFGAPLQKRLVDFGAAGSVLAALGTQMQIPDQTTRADGAGGEHHIQDFANGAVQVDVVSEDAAL